MKRFLWLVILCPFFAHAQWHVNLFGGFANYYGDLQTQAYTTQQSHLALGAGLQYDLNSHFSVLGNLNLGQVGASDYYNTDSYLHARNLSFQSKIYEINTLLEYNILDLNEHRLTPYVFAGIAAYHFNPYAYDSTGKKVFLRPLSTEGEGLPQYPGRKQYSLNQFAIPFGGGIKFRISADVVLSYEIGLRKLFTDYLDDISNTYVDQATLLANKGPEAVEMAYRGNEIKGGAGYPADGTVRGSPKGKDWYYMSGIRVSIALHNQSSAYHIRHGIIDCPKKVY